MSQPELTHHYRVTLTTYEEAANVRDAAYQWMDDNNLRMRFEMTSMPIVHGHGNVTAGFYDLTAEEKQ